MHVHVHKRKIVLNFWASTLLRSSKSTTRHAILNFSQVAFSRPSARITFFEKDLLRIPRALSVFFLKKVISTKIQLKVVPPPAVRLWAEV
jgi:hypothetical protein